MGKPYEHDPSAGLSSGENTAAMEAAKKPVKGQKIYRGYRKGEDEPGSSVGIHWSTNPDVANELASGGMHEAVIEDPKGQVIPHGALGAVQFNPETLHMRESTNSHMMGFDREAEVRLRPGAQITMASGEQRTVDLKSDMDFEYKNLAEHSVQGTPEAAAHWRRAADYPHTQGALFDDIAHMETGEVIGHTPSIENQIGVSTRDRFAGMTEDLDAAVTRRGEDPWDGNYQVVRGEKQIGPGTYERYTSPWS